LTLKVGLWSFWNSYNLNIVVKRQFHLVASSFKEFFKADLKIKLNFFLISNLNCVLWKKRRRKCIGKKQWKTMKRKNHNYIFWNPKGLGWPCIGALRFWKVYWNLRMGERHEITKKQKTKNIFLWFSIEFFGLIFASFQLFHKAKGKVPMVSTIPNLGKCQYILIVRPFCKIHITIMQVHKVIMHIHMNILQTHMCWFAWDIIKQKKPKFKLCLFFILICTPFMQLIPFKFEYYLPNHSTWH
jgi:hypothetical protein